MKVRYLVTTDANQLPDCPIIMIDNAVPNWKPRPGIDLHVGSLSSVSTSVHTDRVPLGFVAEYPYVEGIDTSKVESSDFVCIVSPEFTVSACATAAWVQLEKEELEDTAIGSLLSIAYDCDYFQVPNKFKVFSKFATKATVALELKAFEYETILELPKNPKERSPQQKRICSSLAFKMGTEWLIDAAKGSRPYPGEMGEATEYWRELVEIALIYLEESRLQIYNDALLIDNRGLNIGYIDPRSAYIAARNEGLRYELSLVIKDSKEGYSYVLASSGLNLITKYNAFFTLTCKEAIKRNVSLHLIEESWGKHNCSELIGFDPWGGCEAIGESSNRSPSKLDPREVIDSLRILNS